MLDIMECDCECHTSGEPSRGCCEELHRVKEPLTIADMELFVVGLEDRFWAKVPRHLPQNVCWLWFGYINIQGYGEFYYNYGKFQAHRVAYELVRGNIPADKEIDHLCRVRHCVNPWQMEPVIRKVNLLRGEGPSAKNARKTHCDYGHPFDEPNTRITPTGRRNCRACERRKWRKRQCKKRLLLQT